MGNSTPRSAKVAQLTTDFAEQDWCPGMGVPGGCDARDTWPVWQAQPVPADWRARFEQCIRTTSHIGASAAVAYFKPRVTAGGQEVAASHWALDAHWSMDGTTFCQQGLTLLSADDAEL